MTGDSNQGLSPASNYVNYPTKTLPKVAQPDTELGRPNAVMIPNPVSTYNTNYPESLQGTILSYDPLGDPFYPPSVFEVNASNSTLSSSPAHIIASTTMVQVGTTSPDSTGIPITLHVNPLAKPAVGEPELPVIDTGHEGPLRCSNCALYATAYNKVDEKGVWTCEQCGWPTNIPADKLAAFQSYVAETSSCPTFEYIVRDPRFVPIIQEGKNEDNAPLMRRLGLKVGTPISSIPVFRVFVIHTSKLALVNGAINAVCDGLLAALDQMNDNIRFGLITYDHAISAFDFNPESSHDYPSEIIVPNVEQPGAIASPYKICRPIGQIREKVRDFIKELPQILAERPDYLATDHNASFGCFGSVLQCIHDTFKSLGSTRVTAYVSAADSHGLGRTGNTLASAMEPPKESVTDMIKTKKSFWDSLAEKFHSSKISLDVIANGPTFCDLDSLTKPATVTNGFVKYYPTVDPSSGFSVNLRQDIYTLFSISSGFSATAKIRCTRGINIDRWYGNIPTKNISYNSECCPVNVDENCSLCVKLRHEERLDPSKKYYAQIAILYTHEDGTRRVRLTHYFFNITTKAAEVYRYVCIDALSLYIAKYCLRQESHAKASNNTLFQQIVKPLVAYRNNYCLANPGNKLLIPKSIDFLIYYAYMTHVTAAFQAKETPDARIANRISTLYTNPTNYFQTICPFIYDLTNPSEEWLTVNEEGNIRFPKPIRPCLKFLPSLQDSVLLYTSNSENYLFIGKNIILDIPSGVCTVDYYNQLAAYRNNRAVIVVRENENPNLFRKLAIEDKNGEMSSLQEYTQAITKTVASRADSV